MILRLISIIAIVYVIGWETRFLWPFSVSIHWRSHLKKQSGDLDVVGRVRNDTCQVSEKMRYVNVKVHNNRCLFRKRE